MMDVHSYAWRLMPPAERLQARLVRQPNGCLEFTGSLDTLGYGRVKRNGKWCSAHRLAYEIANGEIPEGMHVLHHCDNRCCCDPAHLFLGSHADNMADMTRKGRHGGHPPRHQGTDFPHAKLDEYKVREIRRLFASGAWTKKSLADSFGVSATVVSTVISRTAWRHVP